MSDYSRPFENTYWVEYPTFLAGEYPGGRRAEDTIARLNRLLDHGVSVFIDLTVENELTPYSGLLQELAVARKAQISYLRYAIPDKGVPSNLELMRDILKAIHRALDAGKTIYVHCWGGIGRTGTTVACYLTEKYNSPEIALTLLADLWPQMEKKSRWPRSPETQQQIAWVHAWPPTSAAATQTSSSQ